MYKAHDLKEHLILGKQKKWKKLLEWIFTIIGWLFMLTFICYLIYGFFAVRNGWYLPSFLFLNREMLEEIGGYLHILAIIFFVGMLVFILWKNYNRMRFGRLHRRQFRPDVSNEELIEKFEVSSDLLFHLQHDRVIILPENIIPDKMGIGYGKRSKTK